MGIFKFVVIVFAVAEVLVLVIIATSYVLGVSKDNQTHAAVRNTYEGRVTAVVYNKDTNASVIYLNSDNQTVRVSGNVQLIIGEEYQIVTDGFYNANMINAVPVEEK